MALKYNKIPGEWLSQSMVATILRDLNSKYKQYDFDILVFIDGAVYTDRLMTISAVSPALAEDTPASKEFEVIETKEYDEFSAQAAATKKEEAKSENAKIVFVSCALGLKSPEPIYLNLLKELFDFPQLIGIMGGRTNEALFFVGYQDDDNVIFLDPHFVQVSIMLLWIIMK